MTAPNYPVLSGVVRDQRRSLTFWAIAMAVVSTIYIAYYPAIGAEDMQSMVDIMPEGFVEALGYDQIGTAAGYIEATVYNLLGPTLLMVFAIGAGARLIAGQEEDGTLELELTAPVPHHRLYAERLAALWIDVVLLVVVVSATTTLLALALDLELEYGNLVAATIGMLMFVGGFGTLALAIGAATGRRAIALGAAAGVAVLSYMLNAIGPSIDAGWMTAISPWSWYSENSPMLNGFDGRGLLLLATIPIVAGFVGLAMFRKRDLMV